MRRLGEREPWYSQGETDRWSSICLLIYPHQAVLLFSGGIIGTGKCEKEAILFRAVRYGSYGVLATTNSTQYAATASFRDRNAGFLPEILGFMIRAKYLLMMEPFGKSRVWITLPL